MRRNVEINGLGQTQESEDVVNPTASSTRHENTSAPKPKLGKVRINEGDAW